MRYFFALSSLILGIVLLLVGVGQRTFLIGPKEITVTSDVTVAAKYTVITAKDLAKIPGKPTLSLGNASGTIAVGNAADVKAWVTGYGYTQLTLDAGEGAVVPRKFAAYGTVHKEAVRFAQSDLWSSVITVRGKTQELYFDGNIAPRQAVVIAGSQDAPVGKDLRISWQQQRYTPWIGPILTVGAFFTLLGIVLYVLFVDRDRRGLGPRRGRQGPLRGIRDIFKKPEPAKPLYQAQEEQNAN